MAFLDPHHPIDVGADVLTSDLVSDTPVIRPDGFTINERLCGNAALWPITAIVHPPGLLGSEFSNFWVDGRSKIFGSVTKSGTVVPNMGTHPSVLSKVLFGQTRRSILALLFGHADEQFYLREIARRGGSGIGATQRELGQLTEAGLISRVRRGHQIYYQANRKNPIFSELKSILAKTSGIRDLLLEGLTSLEDRIKLAFVFGSIARGEESASSDVDVMVVGEVSFTDVVSALGQIEAKTGREVNPTVYGPREFREKLAAKNHFLSTIAKEKKLFVIGDEREFRRLGQ